MHLELDPRGGQQIQNSRRLELPILSGHQAITDDSWIRRHQVLLWSGIFAGHVPPQTHSCTTHQGLLERIELALGIARLDPFMIMHGHRFRRPLSFDGGVDIVEVLGPEFNAVSEQVEDADVPG